MLRSQSFIDEPRVDEVNYFIRKKPKCAITTSDGTAFDSANTATGHIVVDANAPGVIPLIAELNHALLPLVRVGEFCLHFVNIFPKREKMPTMKLFLASFPQILGQLTEARLIDTDTNGVLSKSGNDTTDNWTIDLAVPCFGGYCAQD